MLTNMREISVCAKYSERDATGHVHCSECPLVKDKDGYMCKANSHYDRKKREWVMDPVEEVTE